MLNTVCISKQKRVSLAQEKVGTRGVLQEEEISEVEIIIENGTENLQIKRWMPVFLLTKLCR